MEKLFFYAAKYGVALVVDTLEALQKKGLSAAQVESILGTELPAGQSQKTGTPAAEPNPFQTQ